MAQQRVVVNTLGISSHVCYRLRLHFGKILKTEDLQGPVKDARKMTTTYCAVQGAPKMGKQCSSSSTIITTVKNLFSIQLNLATFKKVKH